LSRSVVGGGSTGGLNESYGGGSPGPDGREGSVLPEDLATQSVRLKEEQLRREGESTCNCQSSKEADCVCSLVSQRRNSEISNYDLNENLLRNVKSSSRRKNLYETWKPDWQLTTITNKTVHKARPR